MTAIPSRQFMLQQAVLNAAVIWCEPTSQHDHERMPGELARIAGVPKALKCLRTDSGYVRPSLVALVRKEFRAIAGSYGIIVL